VVNFAPHAAGPANNRSSRSMKHVLSTIFFATIVIVGNVPGSAAGAEFFAPNARSAAALYAQNCASCHGRAKTAKARRSHARNLNDSEWQDRVSDERIFNSIMNGKGKMPGYSRKLSEPEIDTLVNYVRGLKK
jgi:mono/diheme cytochrome c family protein